mmetsp:Transcript_91017/g.293841  ORF Transcript_91017/g.293841 Transcript_91017/m.293841 type:complete len:353 (-) Transcript_91017:591-1649(-)
MNLQAPFLVCTLQVLALPLLVHREVARNIDHHVVVQAAPRWRNGPGCRRARVLVRGCCRRWLRKDFGLGLGVQGGQLHRALLHTPKRLMSAAAHGGVPDLALALAITGHIARHIRMAADVSVGLPRTIRVAPACLPPRHAELSCLGLYGTFPGCLCNLLAMPVSVSPDQPEVYRGPIPVRMEHCLEGANRVIAPVLINKRQTLLKQSCHISWKQFQSQCPPLFGLAETPSAPVADRDLQIQHRCRPLIASADRCDGCLPHKFGVFASTCPANVGQHKVCRRAQAEAATGWDPWQLREIRTSECLSHRMIVVLAVPSHLRQQVRAANAHDLPRQLLHIIFVLDACGHCTTLAL